MFRLIGLFILYLTIAPFTAAESLPASHLLADEQNTISIFKKTAPFVVNVHRLKQVLTTNQDIYNVKSGMGTGFIWNHDGFVVTNYHVIQGANLIAITLQQGKTLEATLVGADKRKDIAVLKLKNVESLRALLSNGHLPLGDSSQLSVGQKVIAIGNPFGFEHTLTTGVISALHRQLNARVGTRFSNLIQTDASINPGNSGGPLLNSSGELIGMNTIIVSPGGASSGVGFAIPINEIKDIVNQIIQYGRVQQAGIGFEPVSDYIAAKLGVRGVIVGKIIANTPAAQIGLKAATIHSSGRIQLGDVIVAVNRQPINNYQDLINVFDKVTVGSKVDIIYVREGKQLNASVSTIDWAQ